MDYEKTCDNCYHLNIRKRFCKKFLSALNYIHYGKMTALNYIHYGKMTALNYIHYGKMTAKKENCFRCTECVDGSFRENANAKQRIL